MRYIRLSTNEVKTPILTMKCASQVLIHFRWFLEESLFGFRCWQGLGILYLLQQTDGIALSFDEWKLALTLVLSS